MIWLIRMRPVILTISYQYLLILINLSPVSDISWFKITISLASAEFEFNGLFEKIDTSAMRQL